MSNFNPYQYVVTSKLLKDHIKLNEQTDRLLESLEINLIILKKIYTRSCLVSGSEVVKN